MHAVRNFANSCISFTWDSARRPSRRNKSNRDGILEKTTSSRRETTVPDLDRITQDPEVMGGKPCIRGMRVTVGMIVGQIGAGRNIEELLADMIWISVPFSRSHTEGNLASYKSERKTSARKPLALK